MSVVIKTTEMQYRDANGVYHGINAVAEKKITDQEAALDQIIAETQGAVNQLETQKNTIAQTVASMAQLGTDTTLSTPGMAADAKACGDLKSAFKGYETDIGVYHTESAQKTRAFVEYDIPLLSGVQYVFENTGEVAFSNFYGKTGSTTHLITGSTVNPGKSMTFTPSYDDSMLYCLVESAGLAAFKIYSKSSVVEEVKKQKTDLEATFGYIGEYANALSHFDGSEINNQNIGISLLDGHRYCVVTSDDINVYIGCYNSGWKGVTSGNSSFFSFEAESDGVLYSVKMNGSADYSGIDCYIYDTTDDDELYSILEGSEASETVYYNNGYLKEQLDSNAINLSRYSGFEKVYDATVGQKNGEFTVNLTKQNCGIYNLHVPSKTNTTEHLYFTVAFKLGEYSEIKKKSFLLYNINTQPINVQLSNSKAWVGATKSATVNCNRIIDESSVVWNTTPSDSEIIYAHINYQWYKTSITEFSGYVGCFRFIDYPLPNYINNRFQPPVMFIGDSQTMIGTFVTKFKELYDQSDVLSHGYGGSGARQIAMAQGGYSIFVEPFIIPSTTTATEIELTSDLPSSVAIDFLNQTSNGFSDIYIKGVRGNVSKQNGTVYFTRSELGSEVSVDRPVKLKSNYYDTTGNILIVEVGTNDSYQKTWNDIKGYLPDAIREIVNHNNSDKYIVLGLTSKAYCSDVENCNYELATIFGEHFLDIRKYLIAYGLEDADITPTAQDEADIANGEIPSSLRADSVHFNQDGGDVIGQLIYDYGKELGYWE